MFKVVHQPDESPAQSIVEPPTKRDSSPNTAADSGGGVEVSFLLRSLRQKARRLKLWLTALSETERGLVNASLSLESDSMGDRLRSILAQIASKLRESLKTNYFRQLEAKGAEILQRTATFFYGASPKTEELLHDTWLLRYNGLHLESASKLGLAAA